MNNHFAQYHNKNIAFVNKSVGILSSYGIRHMAFIQLNNNTNKATLVSNVKGLAELFHCIGRFSNEFYQSMQKTNNNSTRAFLWPATPTDSIGLALKTLGLSNGMTIIQKGEHTIKTWAYIGDNNDANLLDLFINEKKLFIDFIPVFHNEVLSHLEFDSERSINFLTNNVTEYVRDKIIYPNIPADRKLRYYLSGKFSDVYITTQEKRCMDNLAVGKTYKEIANIMNISSNTVKKHVDSIKLKTGILRRSELLHELTNMGII